MPRAEIPVPSEYSETKPRLLSRVKAKVQERATPAKLITAGALTSVAVILGGLATAKVFEINKEPDLPLIGAPLTSGTNNKPENTITVLPEPAQRDSNNPLDAQGRPDILQPTDEAPIQTTQAFPSTVTTVETTIITVTVEPTTTVPPATTTEQTTTPPVTTDSATTTTEPTQTEEEIPTTTPPTASTSPTNTG